MTAYFSGQGRVFIGARDLNGNAAGLQFVGPFFFLPSFSSLVCIIF